MAALVFARRLYRLTSIRQVSTKLTIPDAPPLKIDRLQVKRKKLHINESQNETTTAKLKNKTTPKELENETAITKPKNRVKTKKVKNAIANCKVEGTTAISKLKKTANSELNKTTTSEKPKDRVMVTKSQAEEASENEEAHKDHLAAILNRRKLYEKLTLTSYLNVCVDSGHINGAFNTLIKSLGPKSIVDIKHFNVVLKGWAKLGAITEMHETRLHMMRNRIDPTIETFLYMLLACTKSPKCGKGFVKNLFDEIEIRKINLRRILQSAYLSPADRNAIRSLIKTFYPKYEEQFAIQTRDTCDLLSELNKYDSKLYDFAGSNDLSQLESWAEHQRSLEAKTSVVIDSVGVLKNAPAFEESSKLWQKFQDLWRKDLSRALDESLGTLQEECSKLDKVHIYPYLCSIDRGIIVKLLLDEIEVNASSASYSQSTNYLHLQLGSKVMKRYFRAKAIQDGSNSEVQKVYNDYLSNYCKNPKIMGQMNSREYIQRRAIESKSYAIVGDAQWQIEYWPQHIVASVGRFLYGILLREIKFDLEAVKHQGRLINTENLVPAFYTAYFQIESSHVIKEEFRAHQEFENFYQKAYSSRLRLNCSFLPTSCPPMPWLSHDLGGYLTYKNELVRASNNYAELMFDFKARAHPHKLYPSMDSLNAISLCPWIVNKEMLDIVIDLFRSGGNADLNVPIHESKMQNDAPKLKEVASKADKMLFNREKKKHIQKRREMYSLWRDCLYRLSIANHFRDRIFWFPHNMDFRGRTYPIPPHFNHLGCDLSRSLLLFAKGRPLGENGLDWLKLHLISLTGTKKSVCLQERLDYANSILHLEVLDSADNPWDGRRWWQANEHPWQVLACCKEIAKAIRSKDSRKYISHFPVHQDGSCNGLQHYAALGRDPEGAKSVNLTPSNTPQDVYSRIVDIVEDLRKADAEGGSEVARSLQGYIQRKVIKQTVMTNVYGVTRYGARAQIAKQLLPKGFPDGQVWPAASYLSGKTFQAIGHIFNKSTSIQLWFTDCASLIAKRYNQPVSWETPLGFPVTQPYTKPRQTNSNVDSNSEYMKGSFTLYNDPLSSLNVAKQRTAFPPNYIHSLDSSHMMLTSLFCQREGLTFVSVHDCFWTHPATVDQMNRICREQFVSLHSEPLLQQLSEQFIRNYAILEQTNPRLRSRTLEEGSSEESADTFQRRVGPQIFASVPKTGKLNLNCVLDSTYFFS